MIASPISAQQPTEQKPATPGSPREQLQHLYHAIGISAVAAAAAQMARSALAPEKPKCEMPACLRDDDGEVAA